MAKWAKRAVVAAAVLFLALWVGVQFILPFFVTEEDLRQKVQEALLESTGFRVEISGSTALYFSPMPGLRMEGVSVYPADQSDKVPFMKSGSVSATLDLLATLMGSPSLSKVFLKDTHWHITAYADGHNNLEPHPPQKDAEAALEKPAPVASPEVAQEENEPAEPAPEQQIDFPVKELVFVNSSLDMVEDGELSIFLQNANGRIRWPGLNDRLSLDITTDFRGKTLTVKGESDQAARLVQGGLGELSFSVRSDFLNADFNGAGVLRAPTYLDGSFKFESGDLPDLFEWLGDPVHASVPIRSISVTSMLKTAGTTLTLRSLQLMVDGVPASGAIEIGLPPGGTPSLAGTLAFETFDIYGFLSTFTPVPVGPGGKGQKIDTAFLRRIKMDLRLSADRASYGPINLSSMAASARIEDRFASFDIAASRFANSSVTARLTLDERNLPQRTGSLRLDTGKIDLNVLADALHISGPLPDARGNISAGLTANLPFWAAAPSDISGTITLKTGAGKLTNFDASQFREEANKGGFFNLSEASGGSMPYQTLDLNARIQNGLVEIVEANIAAADDQLELKGIIPYRNQSLALTGTFSNETDASKNVYFFAGGAWPDIVITPVGSLVRQAAPGKTTP